MRHLVIPARYASSRLPGKPLLEIHGKPMVLRVVDQARQVRGIDDICVATDDARIADCLLYTSPSPRDGLLSRMPSSA